LRWAGQPLARSGSLNVSGPNGRASRSRSGPSPVRGTVATRPGPRPGGPRLVRIRYLR
jgi:hypothetical protein